MTVQFATMYKPVRTIIYQMNEANQVLKQTAYKPSEVPDSLKVEADTAYILAEIRKEDTSGKMVTTRTILNLNSSEDEETQYLETEEKWFANWDMGGAYWEKDNATAQRTFANSPHLFVDKWDTPILCIHGEKDFRILANQAMAAFDAAVMRGVPAELLIYPDENHWVLKPQNGVLWQRTFFEWLDKWLKPAKQ